MDLSHDTQKKPHAVCVPFPAQGHINPFMQLAKFLHSHGFHITFVNTEFNHRRLAKSLGPDFVKGLPDFRFKTILDGLPPSEKDASQDIEELCESIKKHCYEQFKELMGKMMMKKHTSPSKEEVSEVSEVSLIIFDVGMRFAEQVAEELSIQAVQFCTASACGWLGYLQYDELVTRGIVPFKDESFAVDGTLDTTLDWVPGMQNIQLKYLPSFMRVTRLDDIMFRFVLEISQDSIKSSSPIIINTFYELESEVLDVIMAMKPNVYNIGPLLLHNKHFICEKENYFMSSGSSLWKSDTECIQWLEKWEHGSVIYVNYGSITVTTKQHLHEFAWGLANSMQPFLWILRPDVVIGQSATTNLSQDFLDEIKGRGYITSWCPQEKVLAHPSIGVFLTHCGWNSTLESLSYGVPMICWPFFADQQTNCWYACTSWGVGIEINPDVKRDEITSLVIEVIKGEKGKEMRKKSLEWKKKAMEAIDIGKSSYTDFQSLLKEVLNH